MSSVRLEKAETQVTVIVIGAGERGHIYCQYALELPEQLKVIVIKFKK